MATQTSQDRIVEQKLKTIKESINIALRAYRDIGVESSNGTFSHSSFVSKLQHVRTCGTNLADALQSITRVV